MHTHTHTHTHTRMHALVHVVCVSPCVDLLSCVCVCVVSPPCVCVCCLSASVSPICVCVCAYMCVRVVPSQWRGQGMLRCMGVSDMRRAYGLPRWILQDVEEETLCAHQGCAVLLQEPQSLCPSLFGEEWWGSCDAPEFFFFFCMQEAEL